VVQKLGVAHSGFIQHSAVYIEPASVRCAIENGWCLAFIRMIGLSVDRRLVSLIGPTVVDYELPKAIRQHAKERNCEK